MPLGSAYHICVPEYSCSNSLNVSVTYEGLNELLMLRLVMIIFILFTLDVNYSLFNFA